MEICSPQIERHLWKNPFEKNSLVWTSRDFLYAHYRSVKNGKSKIFELDISTAGKNVEFSKIFPYFLHAVDALPNA